MYVYVYIWIYQLKAYMYSHAFVKKKNISKVIFSHSCISHIKINVIVFQTFKCTSNPKCLSRGKAVCGTRGRSLFLPRSEDVTSSRTMSSIKCRKYRRSRSEPPMFTVRNSEFHIVYMWLQCYNMFQYTRVNHRSSYLDVFVCESGMTVKSTTAVCGI